MHMYALTHSDEMSSYCNTPQHTATHCKILQHTAARCSTLQYTATHCNTRQRTATHCSTLMRRRRVSKVSPEVVTNFAYTVAATVGLVAATVEQAAATVAFECACVQQWWSIMRVCGGCNSGSSGCNKDNQPLISMPTLPILRKPF